MHRVTLSPVRGTLFIPCNGRPDLVTVASASLITQGCVLEGKSRGSIGWGHQFTDRLANRFADPDSEVDSLTNLPINRFLPITSLIGLTVDPLSLR